MIPLVNLRRQYQTIKPDIDAAIQGVLESCAFVQNKYCRQFEEEFAQASGTDDFVSCSSGTTALELALRAYDIGEGDEVIVPSFTFIATAEAVITVGARPVFAEIDEVHYTLAPADVEKRITARTKAIIPVHLYGQSADMDEICAIAMKHDLFVIEDCAQAHMSEYKGKPVPVGEIGCFSFYPGKNLGAYGDAGGVAVRNAALAKRMREYRDHGRKAGKKYEHDFIGNNFRMDDIQAAVLSVKLRRLPEWTERRRYIAEQYTTRLFSGQAGILVPTEAVYAKHAYHLFAIRVQNRDSLLRRAKELQIGCGVHYPIPLHLQPAYRFLGYSRGDFPLSEQIAGEVISVPICSDITDEEIRTVADTLRGAMQQTGAAEIKTRNARELHRSVH